MTTDTHPVIAGDVEGVDCQRRFPDDPIDNINSSIDNRDRNGPDRDCRPGDIPGVDCRERERLLPESG